MLLDPEPLMCCYNEWEYSSKCPDEPQNTSDADAAVHRWRDETARSQPGPVRLRKQTEICLLIRLVS